MILINDLSFFYSHRLNIAEYSKAKGFEVVIGYGELGGADPKRLENKCFKATYIPIQRGGINPFKDMKSLFYIWKFFKKEKPDIVHLVTIKPYLYGGIISRLIGIPCLVSAVTGLGSLFISNNLKSKIFRLFLFPIYKFAFNHFNQKIILQNKDDLNHLKKWGVLNLRNVKIIKGSGVNLEMFTNLTEQSGTPVVCFAARLLKDKGVLEFVSAARQLKEKNINARFLLAGNLDANNPTSLSIEDLSNIKKDGYVEILGHVKDIPALYRMSHIICLPSYREGMPKSLLEAAAAGRAVVTTDVPGCRDAIIPNKTGLLVPVNDYRELARSIQWLIKNPHERVAMGKAGRKFAEKEFPTEKIVNAHLNIYRELIDQKSTSQDTSN